MEDTSFAASASAMSEEKSCVDDEDEEDCVRVLFAAGWPLFASPSRSRLYPEDDELLDEDDE